jgi:signal transduction histidine kinase/CheY-like chemotaxis protein
MLAVLGIYLIGSAALVAVPLTGDYIRTGVAVCLAVVPTSLRFLYEGFQGNTLIMLLGIGGILMTISIVSMCRIQEQIIVAQYEQRKREKHAARAVANVGLAKSRFFAAVSHDLRQPVNAIGLYLDPLIRLSRTAQDEAAQHAIEGIRQSWRALDDLLSQVLDLTRMDSGVVQAHLQAIEIAPLVRSLIMQHSAAAERAGVRLVTLVKSGKYAIADDLMLQRVLSNLIDNAIKFSPSGGVVVVVLRSAKNTWRIQVRDAGVGIALDAQDKIFEEFVQLGNDARDRQNGLGLGLAISKRFTVLMGGQLEVRSAPGCGCCMTVTLHKTTQPHPIAITDSAEVSLWANPAFSDDHRMNEVALPIPGFTGRGILLVEDDLLVADAMCQLLRSWGTRVRHVETAAEALQEPAFEQVAICDVRLPDGESGLEVALQLRRKGMKVLLLSGETSRELRSSAKDHRLQLLTKPVSSFQLLSALQGL